MQKESTNVEASTKAPISAKRMLGDVYRSVLNLYLSKDEYRLSMHSPFFQNEFVIATDAHKLICFNKDLLNAIDFESHPKPPNALAIIPNDNMCIDFDVQKLRESIIKSNKKFSNKYKVSIKRCPDCNGNGYINSDFRDYKGKYHEFENECPTCEKQSEFKIITEIETSNDLEEVQELLKFDKIHFDVEQFQVVVKTAEMLNVKILSLVSSKNEYSLSKFKVGECTICIMPAQKLIDDRVVTNIA